MSDGDELPTVPKPAIVDAHNVDILYVDWIVTGGKNLGVVNLSLGTIDHSLVRDPADIARIVLATNLRMPVDFAARLHAYLGEILHGQPSAPTPPKNTMN